MRTDRELLDFLKINFTDVLVDLEGHKYIFEEDGYNIILKDINLYQITTDAEYKALGEFHNKGVAEVFKDFCNEIIKVAPPISYTDIIKEQVWNELSIPEKIYLEQSMRAYEIIKFIKEEGTVKRVDPNGDIIVVRIPHPMTEEGLDLFGIKRKGNE